MYDYIKRNQNMNKAKKNLGHNSGPKEQTWLWYNVSGVHTSTGPMAYIFWEACRHSAILQSYVWNKDKLVCSAKKNACMFYFSRLFCIFSYTLVIGKQACTYN